MIICDTNILIEFYKGNDDVTNLLSQIGIENISISAITQAELYFGALNKTELRKIKKHLSILNIFPVTTKITSKFVKLMETYSLSHKICLPDALIASTTIINDVELYTLNLKDFQFIDELRIFQS